MHLRTSTYIGRHTEVRAAKGSASVHLCACGAPAKDWATLHGGDGSKLEDYVAMCRPHHAFYDSVHNPTAKAWRRNA